MSSQRVRYIKQFFPINGYSYNPTTDVVTITANGHSLFTGAGVYITSDNHYYAYKATANVTSANTFTVPAPNDLQMVTHYMVDGYLSGQTGPQSSQTLPRATGTETVIQSYVNGTGGASYWIDISLDDSHWIPTANMVHSTATGNTTYLTISPGWAYMRANINYVGANTNLVIMTGE